MHEHGCSVWSWWFQQRSSSPFVHQAVNRLFQHAWTTTMFKLASSTMFKPVNRQKQAERFYVCVVQWTLSLSTEASLLGGVSHPPKHFLKPEKFGQTKGCLWLLAHPIKFGQFYKNNIFGRFNEHTPPAPRPPPNQSGFATPLSLSLSLSKYIYIWNANSQL